MKQKIYEGIVIIHLQGAFTLEKYRSFPDREIFFLGCRQSKIVIHDFRPEIKAEVKALQSGDQKDTSRFAEIFSTYAKAAVYESGLVHTICLRDTKIRNFSKDRPWLWLAVLKSNRVPSRKGVIIENYSNINPGNGNVIALDVVMK